MYESASLWHFSFQRTGLIIQHLRYITEEQKIIIIKKNLLISDKTVRRSSFLTCVFSRVALCSVICMCSQDSNEEANAERAVTCRVRPVSPQHRLWLTTSDPCWQHRAPSSDGRPQHLSVCGGKPGLQASGAAAAHRWLNEAPAAGCWLVKQICTKLNRLQDSFCSLVINSTFVTGVLELLLTR